MKTYKIYFKALTNSEHFQFHTEFKNLVNTSRPDVLKIKEEFEAYTKLYNQEDEVLKKIVKSEFTEAIQAADQKRDATFRSMVDQNKAMINHFQAEIQASAKRLQIVFDTYGNLAKRSLHQETADMYNLIQDLKGKYLNDVKIVRIDEWLTEMEKNNNEVEKLVNVRYDEAAARTTLVLREVRQAVDAAYRVITERVEALLIVEKEDTYEAFINRLNIVIEAYNTIIAQRAGRSEKKKSEETKTEIQ